MAGLLQLEAREFRDLTRWRWVLTDASGAFLADHEVRLDASAAEYEAFTDLRGYLRWHCAPDRRAADEARIVGGVGAWIGSRVLGPAVTAALVRQRPATVRVVVPPEATELLYRPLELAHGGGKPLAVQDVTLVMEAGAGTAARIEPVGERLRVLGLFSLPEGGRALNLRRERAELVRLVREIAGGGKAADVRVLQYGVTRERLRDALAEAEGWDIIHVSGHGSPGSLTLETSSGSPDRVTAAELADLLDPARVRVKLVTLSACWSAAVLADEQRHLLGLPVQDKDDSTERDPGDSSPPAYTGALATELAGQLGCAVLAMRYPVGDDFAIALSEKLYSLLADKGQPLPRAVGMTLRELSAAAGGPHSGRPNGSEAGGSATGNGTGGNGAGGTAFSALSVATPALFGGVAADLRLAAPARGGPASYDTEALKMAGFSPEPSRFVGRTAVLARSSAVLAPRSGVPGVLLHGMPGSGKTACALELAYGHKEAFDRLVWFKAPDDDSASESAAIDGALTDFALTLERYLDGFQMAHVLVSSETLEGFLPRLTELMEQRRVLIVIDNAESLLTESGEWRDDRWGAVLGALTGHTGLGRVIVTSRRVPAARFHQPTVGLPGVRVEAVDALSADEALLLARELPNLTALTLGKVPGLEANVSRTLARNAIAMAQGHPKLLELAEGQAANPDHLLALVKAGDQAWRRLGGVPDGFFASGEATATGEDYLTVLAAWTKAVTDTLMPGERDLFWFLCCLEEADRERAILENNWADLWQRLDRGGTPSALAPALAAIISRGLAAIMDAATLETEDGIAQSCLVHPAVAEAGRIHAGQAFRDAVDIEAAAFWDAVFLQASGEADDGTMHTELLVRAGLAASPYLIRQQHWDDAAVLLESAFMAGRSRATATAMLPAARLIASRAPDQTALLALVMEEIDLVVAEALTRAALLAADARGDYLTASVIAGRLVDICSGLGRLAEALSFSEQEAAYLRRADHGPWDELNVNVHRLQLLNNMDRPTQVLEEVLELRDHVAALSTISTLDQTADPWITREVLFATGRYAAILLDRWEVALGLNAEVTASMRERNAPALDIARQMFSDSSPLIGLGHLDEAMALLLNCRQVFEDANDLSMLSSTLSVLAAVEDKRGHGDAATRLSRDSVRYAYLADEAIPTAAAYENLGDLLHHHARQYGMALASHLASALIRVLVGVGGSGTVGLTRVLHAAARDLAEFGTADTLPVDTASLDRQLGDIPGTDLPGLIAELSPDPDTAEQALRDIIAQAQELAAAPPPDASPDPGPAGDASG